MNTSLKMDVSTSADEKWHDLQKRLDGNIYHSREWAQTQASPALHPLFFSWSDSTGECLGYAVGLERHSLAPLIGHCLKHLSFESYPVVKDNSSRLLKAIFSQLRNYAVQNGYLSLTVNSFLSDTEARDFSELGYTTSERLEFVIDLNKNDDELFRALATRHKRKVKKARKHDLAFQEAESMEALWQFRSLQVQSRDRRLKRGESIGMLDDSFYEHLGKTYFEKKLGRVFLLTSGEEPVSAAFVSIYGGKGYYTYGGSSDEGFRLEAPPLLFLNIFARCRELGCHAFNLGGVPAKATDTKQPSHGLYMFKAGFGGREIPCSTLHADALQPGRAALLKIANILMRRKENG